MRKRMATSALPNRRRASPVWPIIVLLLLSHSVWNTLQCSTSQSQKGSSRDDSSGNELVRGKPQSSDPYFFRPGRGDHEVEVESFQACQNRLRYEMVTLCNGMFFDPSSRTRNSMNEEYGQHNKRSVARLNRMPRSLVDECCNKPCTKDFVQKFCQTGSQGSNRNKSPSFSGPETSTPEVSSPNLQPISSVEEETEPEPVPEPVLYYPLFHFIKFMHRQFGNKLKLPVVVEGEQQALGHPIAQARTQDEHPASHAHSLNSYSRNGFARPENYNVAPEPMGYDSQRTALSAALHNSGAFADSPSHIHFPIRTGFQEEERGSRRPTGSSRNAVTSTLPPYVIPLGKLTSDYKK